MAVTQSNSASFPEYDSSTIGEKRQPHQALDPPLRRLQNNFSLACLQLFMYWGLTCG